MPDQNSAAPSDQRAVNIARVSTITATAIAVADMIGIGVFTSLGFQVGASRPLFALLMLWVVGGITALCGALAYAELAAALPRSGGEYNFLSRIYHPAVGFLAGWVSATVGFAAPIAVAAMAFGSYFEGVFPGSPPLCLGWRLVWIVSLVHLSGVRHEQHVPERLHRHQGGADCGVHRCRLCLRQPAAHLLRAVRAGPPYIVSAPFAISLVFVMYSYSGWNAATYIINEVRDPERSLPRSLLAATLIVLVLYVGLNAVFLYTTPMEKMAGQINVAQVAGTHIFGEARRPGCCRADLYRPRLGGQRHDLDRAARDHGDRRGHPGAALLCAHDENRRSGDGDPFSAGHRHAAAVHAKLRSGHRLHSVQPDLLHLPGRAWASSCFATRSPS